MAALGAPMGRDATCSSRYLWADSSLPPQAEGNATGKSSSIARRPMSAFSPRCAGKLNLLTVGVVDVPILTPPPSLPNATGAITSWMHARAPCQAPCSLRGWVPGYCFGFLPPLNTSWAALLLHTSPAIFPQDPGSMSNRRLPSAISVWAMSDTGGRDTSVAASPVHIFEVQVLES